MFQCLLSALVKHLFIYQKPTLFLQIHRPLYTGHMSPMKSRCDDCAAFAERLYTVEITDMEVLVRQTCFHFRIS